MKSKRLYYINRIIDLLLEKKAQKMKVEDIASAIGVTKKTIYNYFDSKQELSECIIDYYIRHKLNLVRTAMKEGLSPVATLIMLSETVNNAYNECCLLLTPLGKIRNTESFSQIVEGHQKELMAIAEHTFKKAIHEGLFEIDIDTMLTSRLYISSIHMLSRSDSSLNLIIESKEQQKETLFYLLKGVCTPSGLAELRQMLNIRVSSVSGCM